MRVGFDPPNFRISVNGKHASWAASLQFTSESRVDSHLVFLGFKIWRLQDKFPTSEYREPNFTGLSLRFFGFVPRSSKLNRILALFHTSYKISSDFFFEISAEMLTINGFPKKLLYDCIDSSLKLKYSPSTLFLVAVLNKYCLSLPCYGTNQIKWKIGSPSFELSFSISFVSKSTF